MSESNKRILISNFLNNHDILLNILKYILRNDYKNFLFTNKTFYKIFFDSYYSIEYNIKLKFKNYENKLIIIENNIENSKETLNNLIKFFTDKKKVLEIKERSVTFYKKFEGIYSNININKRKMKFDFKKLFKNIKFKSIDKENKNNRFEIKIKFLIYDVDDEIFYFNYEKNQSQFGFDSYKIEILMNDIINFDYSYGVLNGSSDIEINNKEELFRITKMNNMVELKFFYYLLIQSIINNEIEIIKGKYYYDFDNWNFLFESISLYDNNNDDEFYNCFKDFNKNKNKNNNNNNFNNNFIFDY
jgi:hypothetical protein